MRIVLKTVTMPIRKPDNMSDAELIEYLTDCITPAFRLYEYDSFMLEDIGLTEDQIKSLIGGPNSVLFDSGKFYACEVNKREAVAKHYRVFRITLLAKEDGE